MLDETEQAQHWGPAPTGDFMALAMDIGSRKIGIASGHSRLGQGTPRTIISARQGQPDWAQFEQLLASWQPRLIVIGWPLNMDATPTRLTASCERCANKIHGRYRLPVRCVDERLSTREAYELALAAHSSHKQAAPVDALAAVVILETYFRGL